MKSIGGYFELEKIENYGGRTSFDNFQNFNLCRNALVYFLKEKKIRTLHIPYFTCHVIKDVLSKNNIKYNFYHVDEAFEIIDLHKIDGALLYTNYFGLKSRYVSVLWEMIGERLIVDQAQAFYEIFRSNPYVEVFSARKYFGVSDGAFLNADIIKTDNTPNTNNGKDISNHLLLRSRGYVSEGYKYFKINEEILTSRPIERISVQSINTLERIDYDKVKEMRRRNYKTLMNGLEKINISPMAIDSNDVPLTFPLVVEFGSQLKSKLIEDRIFIPTYWPELLRDSRISLTERGLVSNIVHLPIDQRYSETDMLRIINKIDEFISRR